MRVNGSQLVMEVLLQHGVDTIFGYPGGAALNLYDALYEYSDRRVLCDQRPGSNQSRYGHRDSLHGQRASRRDHGQRS